jgi:hypothetical protein
MAKIMKVIVEKAAGGRQEFTVLPVTIVAFERQFKKGLGDADRMEDVYWLAWDSERRSGATVPPFDTWLESIVSVEEVQEASPLDEAASPDA